MHIVTTACHAVLNTQFIAPEPKPDWFDDLSGKLDAAKVLANEWIDDIATDMTASIPTSVMRCATSGMTAVIVTSLRRPMSPVTRMMRSPVRRRLW